MDFFFSLVQLHFTIGPFFFFLSGLVYNDRDTWSVIKKRFKTLIIPYLLFCVLGLCITMCVGPSVSLFRVIKDLYYGNPENIWVSSVWFLVALFFTTSLFSIILKIRNKFLQYFVVMVLFLIGITFGSAYNSGIITHRLPLNIDVVFVAILFFAIGYYSKAIFNRFNQDIKSDFKLIICLICTTSLFCLISLANKRINLHSLEYGNPLLFVIAAFLGIYALLCFSELLTSLSLKKYLIWAGRNNIYILGAQAIGVRVFIRLLNHLIGTEYVLYSLPYKYAIFSFVFTCLFSLLFTVVIQNTLKLVWRKI